MKCKMLKDKKLEWIVLLLFASVYIFVSIFHEPWFDEAQAWEIAKGASLKEILFIIPHYECHPPLWHLILMVPAKLGVPFEIGLKTIALIISLATVFLLVFKSRLPRTVRLCLPFSYFLFYQYGVIVRPYGLMILILLLLGMNLSQRKGHPWRITILLSILCLCSAYGIVISGGIAVCLVIEIFQDKGVKKTFDTFFKDSRSVSLLALLMLAILLLYEIFPKPETFYVAYKEQNSLLLCLICALLTFPAECFLTSSSWFSIDRSLLQTSNIPYAELIILCLIGAILWLLIICSASKKNLIFLLIPYFFLAAFSAFVYFSGHHLGVAFMFFLFWAEYICREEDSFEIGHFLMGKIVVEEKDFKLLRTAYVLIGMACLVIPIIWTVLSSAHDVRYDYYYSRRVAKFLEENNLTNLLILGCWYEDGSLVPFSEGDEDYVNTVMIGTAVPVNAYFEGNIFFNLNHGDSNKGYIYHRRPSHMEAERTLEEWRHRGYPDLIIGKPHLELVYGKAITYSDYKLIALEKSKYIWKTGLTAAKMPVFLRNDLLDQYGLEALEGIEYTAINGFDFTDEMKERYFNGDSIEEILKPYLDAMFGEEEA